MANNEEEITALVDRLMKESPETRRALARVLRERKNDFRRLLADRIDPDLATQQRRRGHPKTINDLEVAVFIAVRIKKGMPTRTGWTRLNKKKPMTEAYTLAMEKFGISESAAQKGFRPWKGIFLAEPEDRPNLKTLRDIERIRSDADMDRSDVDIDRPTVDQEWLWFDLFDP
jgi:hypothetical protein